MPLSNFFRSLVSEVGSLARRKPLAQLRRERETKGFQNFLDAPPEATPIGPQSIEPPPLAPAAETELDTTRLDDRAAQDAEDAEWRKMGSTNVDEIRYLAPERTLEVLFLSGALYQYYDVPRAVFEAFTTTMSPGRFVWNHLRDVFDYKRISGPSGPRKPPNVLRGLTPKEEADWNKAGRPRNWKK